MTDIASGPQTLSHPRTLLSRAGLSAAELRRRWRYAAPGTRMAVGGSLSVSGVLLTLTIGLSWTARTMLTETFHQNGEMMAHELATAAAAPMARGDFASLNQQVKACAYEHRVRLCLIADESESVIASSDARLIAQRFPDKASNASASAGGHIVLDHDEGRMYAERISGASGTQGVAWIVIDAAPLRGLDLKLGAIVGGAVLFTLVGLLFVLRSALRDGTAGIGPFVEAAQRLAAGKSISAVALPETGALAPLTAEFRSVADRLALVMHQISSDSPQEFTPKRYSTYISHEIRNLVQRLLGVVSFAGLAARDQSPELPHLIDELKRQLFAMSSFCSDVMTYARPVSDRRKPVDLSSMLRGLARDIPREEGLLVELSLNEERPVFVMGDPISLERAFLNVIRNAVESMSGGGGTIQLRAEETTYLGKEAVRITITDTGCGVPSSDLEHIFEPFWSRKKGGTGLGMPIVKEVVAAHNGGITLTSEVGRGSIATITLPTCPAPQRLVNSARDGLSVEEGA